LYRIDMNHAGRTKEAGFIEITPASFFQLHINGFLK